MQLFKEVDGGNPDGTAKDAIGLSSGTTYLQNTGTIIFSIFST